MTTCEQWGERISALVDGELEGEQDSVEREEVLAHLRQCPSCQRSVEVFRSLDQWLLPEVGCNGRASRVQRAVESELTARRPTREPRAGTSWRNPAMIAARLGAAAAILVTGSLLILALGDRADAGKIAMPMAQMESYHTRHLQDQELTLKTLQWELRAMKLQVEGMDVSEEERVHLLDRIEGVLRGVQSVALPAAAPSGEER